MTRPTPPVFAPDWTPRETTASVRSAGTPEPPIVPPAPPLVQPAAGITYGYTPAVQPAPLTPYVYAPRPITTGHKSFVGTWLLSWFFGVLGADRFYLGKLWTGLLKLFTFGGFGIWALIDVVVIIVGGARDAQGLRLEGYDKHKVIVWIVSGGLMLIGTAANLAVSL